MIEPRIYRAAFVPALLAVVLALFSLESRPRPLPQGLPADVLFEDDTETTTARDRRVRARPARRASPGTARRPRLVRDAFREPRLHASRPTASAQGSTDLVNVIGRRAGRSRRQIVVVAARDARRGARRRRAARPTPPR